MSNSDSNSESNKTWSLFQQPDEHRVDLLSLDEVKLILKSIPASRMNLWLARDQEASEWKSLYEFAELGLPPRSAAGPSVAPQIKSTGAASTMKLNEMATEDHEFFDDFTLEIDHAAVEDRRSSRRYNKAYSVLLEGGDQDFQTQTVDISLSGLYIEDPIPSWAGNVFELRLTREGEHLFILCSRVKIGKGNKLIIEKISAPDLLRQWLLL